MRLTLAPRSHNAFSKCWDPIEQLIVGNPGSLKDRNDEPDRGSEWEPIKILHKNSAYEPKITRTPP
jgi:hypothetical protein